MKRSDNIAFGFVIILLLIISVGILLYHPRPYRRWRIETNGDTKTFTIVLEWRNKDSTLVHTGKSSVMIYTPDELQWASNLCFEVYKCKPLEKKWL